MFKFIIFSILIISFILLFVEYKKAPLVKDECEDCGGCLRCITKDKGE